MSARHVLSGCNVVARAPCELVGSCACVIDDISVTVRCCGNTALWLWLIIGTRTFCIRKFCSHYSGLKAGINLSEEEQRDVGAFEARLRADICALSDYHQRFTEADVLSKIDLSGL
jgi:hypothetical protein